MFEHLFCTPLLWLLVTRTVPSTLQRCWSRYRPASLSVYTPVYLRIWSPECQVVTVTTECCSSTSRARVCGSAECGARARCVGMWLSPGSHLPSQPELSLPPPALLSQYLPSQTWFPTRNQSPNISHSQVLIFEMEWNGNVSRAW